MTEQPKDPIQLAIEKLKGLRCLVPESYVDLSPGLYSAIDDVIALQSQPAAAHGVEGLDAGKPFPRSDDGICENPECKSDGARWLKHGVKCCFICRPDVKQFAQSRQALPADKQAALDAWEHLLGEISAFGVNLHDGTLDTINGFIRTALTTPEPVADLEGLKRECHHAMCHDPDPESIYCSAISDTIDHLHATGRLTTSADVQELNDAVRDYEDRLALDQGIFAYYADLRSMKGTEDGKALCAAALQNGNIIALLRQKHAPTIAKVKGV